MPSPLFRPPTHVRAAISPLTVAVAPAGRRHRRLIEAITRRARSNGAPHDQELLALVFLGRERLEQWYPATETRGHYWTRTQVNHLITLDIPNVCAIHGIGQPSGVAEQVWLLLDHLHDDGLLHFDSDTIDQLLQPLRCYSRLDEQGRPNEPEAATPHPCRCYWPTRKQLDLGLEKSPPPMPDSFDWYGPERATAEQEWAADNDWRLAESRGAMPTGPTVADAS